MAGRDVAADVRVVDRPVPDAGRDLLDVVGRFGRLAHGEIVAGGRASDASSQWASKQPAAGWDSSPRVTWTATAGFQDWRDLE